MQALLATATTAATPAVLPGLQAAISIMQQLSSKLLHSHGTLLAMHSSQFGNPWVSSCHQRVQAGTAFRRTAARHQQLATCCTQAVASSLSADTDVESTIKYAAAAAGRQMTEGDLQLVKHLRSNWYHTAGDIAAMSQEETELLCVPVKLWAMVRSQLQSAEADPACHSQLLELPSSTGHKQQHHISEQQQPQQPAATAGFAAADTVGQLLTLDAQQKDAAHRHHQVLPADIMQRRMPAKGATAARGRTEAIAAVAVRHKPLLSTVPYSLKDDEMSDALRAELQEFEKFCTIRFLGQLVEPVKPVTHRRVTLHNVKMMLGFAHRVRGVPLDQLSLKTLLPSSDREGVSLLLDYQHWRQSERGTTATTAINPIKSFVHVARFLYHDQAQPINPVTGLRQRYPYHNLEVVQELGVIQRAAQKASAKAPKVSDESKKWLEWTEFLGLVRALRAECAGLTASGSPRSRHEVAASLQRYLIVAILSVVPDRQRTLRELELGRTLLQRDGAWVIKHGPDDYKTGKQYGDRPPLVIAPFIYPELEAFINTWRKELQPKTNMLFCRTKTGGPMTENDVYFTFKHAALRLTGKATHPHLVRDMIVTHLRKQQKGEAQMEALAMYMGHSLEMQKATYDRRTQVQKLAPAMELLQRLHSRKAQSQKES